MHMHNVRDNGGKLKQDQHQHYKKCIFYIDKNNTWNALKPITAYMYYTFSDITF